MRVLQRNLSKVLCKISLLQDTATSSHCQNFYIVPHVLYCGDRQPFFNIRQFTLVQNLCVSLVTIHRTVKCPSFTRTERWLMSANSSFFSVRSNGRIRGRKYSRVSSSAEFYLPMASTNPFSVLATSSQTSASEEEEEIYPPLSSSVATDSLSTVSGEWKLRGTPSVDTRPSSTGLPFDFWTILKNTLGPQTAFSV